MIKFNAKTEDHPKREELTVRCPLVPVRRSRDTLPTPTTPQRLPKWSYCRTDVAEINCKYFVKILINFRLLSTFLTK